MHIYCHDVLFSVIGTGNGMVKVAQGCVDPVTSTLHIIKGMFTYKWCNVGGRIMVFHSTFNNISVISMLSVFWWRKLKHPEKTTLNLL